MFTAAAAVVHSHPSFWTITATSVTIVAGLLAVLGVLWRFGKRVMGLLSSIEANTRDVEMVREDVKEVKVSLTEVKSRLIARSEHQADQMREALERIESKIDDGRNGGGSPPH